MQIECGTHRTVCCAVMLHIRQWNEAQADLTRNFRVAIYMYDVLHSVNVPLQVITDKQISYLLIMDSRKMFTVEVVASHGYNRIRFRVLSSMYSKIENIWH